VALLAAGILAQFPSALRPSWRSLSPGIPPPSPTPGAHTLLLLPLPRGAWGEGEDVAASSLPALTYPSVKSAGS